MIGRIEERYTDFGHADYAIPNFPGFTSRVDLKTSALRIGIAYKF